jgi:hypothetical protein
MEKHSLLMKLKLQLMQEGRQGSFTFKVFKIFFVFVLAITIVLTSLSVHYQTGKVKDDLSARGKTLATLLANSCRIGVFIENLELLNDAADGVMSQKEVLRVAIYSADGKELLMRYSTFKKGISASGSGPEPIEAGQAIEFIEPIILEQRQGGEDELYFGRTAAKSERAIIGQVKVALDGSVVAEGVKSIVAQNIMIGCLFLLIGTIFLAVALKRVLGPLSQLTTEVKMLGEGKSIEKISVGSQDEIGRLSMAFNDMAEKLKRREEEKIKLEQQLRHAQKMEAVGTLARGIAHDFNNILTTVQASIYIIQKKIDKADSIYPYVSRMNNSISRAKMLIQSLLTFSRGQTVKLFPIEINTTVANMEPMIRAMVGEGIECSIMIPEAPLVVMADSTQMEQVLLNLAANARDAMPDGGTLTITIDKVDVAAGDRIARPGAYSRIVVADTGEGIRDEIKERIFEPFFTTKEVGKGTGLGLSIVYGIIEQHQGYIFVDSGPGKGAAFSIYLPLFEKNGRMLSDAGTEETHG